MNHAKNSVRFKSWWWRSLSSVALAGLCLLGGAMTGEKPNSAPVSESDEGKIQMLLALVWEGRDLAPHNLAALEEFRREYPDVSVIHLVNPAYFTKPKADGQQVAAALKAHVRPQDQVGLLLGPWRTLTQAAGVIFRPAPTFWSPVAPPGDCVIDCGGDVPLTIYPEADVDKLLAQSIKLLESHGFARPVGFAVQGWMASANIQESAVRAGLRFDFSAVAPDLLVSRVRHYPLYSWARAMWPDITPHSQPYTIQTGAGPVVEVPMSLAAMDYVTRKEVDTLFQEYVQLWQQEPAKDLIFPLVFSQETAMVTVPFLRNALKGIFATAASRQVPLAAMRLPDELPSGWDETHNRPAPKAPVPLAPSAAPATTPGPVTVPVAH